MAYTRQQEEEDTTALLEFFKEGPEIKTELIDEELIDELCSVEDIWSGLYLPNVNNNDIFIPNGDLPCLATPPLSPPDSIDTTPSPPPSSGYHGMTTQLNNAGFINNSFTNSNVTDNGSSSSGNTTFGNVLSLPSYQHQQCLNSLSPPLPLPPSHVTNSMQQINHSSVKKEETIQPVSKREQRLMKNRQSALQSRRKKKEYIDNLESLLREAANKNATILKENEILKKTVKELQLENEFLRKCSSIGPSSPLSSVPKPALVLVVVLCFTVSIFPLKGYLVPPTTQTITSLQAVHSPGRALMSLPPSYSLPPPLLPLLEPSNNNKRPSLLHRRPHPSQEAEPTICTCPPATPITKQHNYTKTHNLNTQLSVNFGGQKEKYISSHDSSLIVLSHEQENQESGCQCHSTQDMSLLYKSLKKTMIRDLNQFYLISFKDHLLLNAPMRNSSIEPSLSVIIPANNGTHNSPPGYISMLQLHCKVTGSTILHMQAP